MNYFRLLASLAALALSPAVAVQPLSGSADFRDSFLGTAPWLDPDAPPPPQPPSFGPKAVVVVPAIDTSNIAAVAAAYNAYYNVAMPAVGFTGSTATCNPGSISLAFQEWTISRINFLRAMAGVPGDTTLDASKNAQEQAAALIMAANSTLNHFPPNTYTCWSQAGYDGASSSNLALGTGLTDSIPLYMTDPGGGNQVAGHRRWILHSRKNSFGLGQANGSPYSASALYTFQFGSTISVPNGIAWPPRGYVPLALFPAPFSEGPRWSFGMPGANFGSATVTMTLNGSPLAVTVVSRTDNGYGDNTIVWELPAGHTVAKGSTYAVTISGVASAGSTTYGYQVLPFDPADVPPTRAVTVSKIGTGSGTVTSVPFGINCGATCTANFTGGSAVTLNAAAAAGATFAGWSGACTGTAACALTMDAAKSVTATFNAIASPAPLSANPVALAFGGQSVNTTSPSLSMTITNTGGALLTVTSVATSAYFAATHNCVSLAAGASCTATINFTPAVDGALTGSLAINTSGGSQSFALTGTGEKSLVTHYYRSILRRAPDAGGKVYWDGEAARMQSLGVNVNETWYSMAGSFYTSTEYLAFNRDDTGFVTDLYNTFFNRPPDGAGLTYWTGQLASGLPREVALVSFMFSTEFVNFTQAIFGNTAVRKEIDTVVDFYRGLLARLPDSAGFNFWVQQFRTAQCQGAAAVTAQAESISSQFALSPEYAARGRNNSQYVGDLYNAFLRRGGDLAGVQFWISQIATSAQTREQVRRQFVASPEFSARVAAVIAQGCL